MCIALEAAFTKTHIFPVESSRCLLFYTSTTAAITSRPVVLVTPTTMTNQTPISVAIIKQH